MLVFWGDGSQTAMDLVKRIEVRSTANFNWTFIFILAVVFYVYWSEINKKNYEAVYAGLALYGVHWLYEIGNAVIGHVTGYPLWSVSNESTTFALVESFLAGTSNHSFIWVYKWWGVLPVFITTYIPFFLASNYVPDMEPAKRKRFLIIEWILVALLLVILIPLGVI